jgi:aminoglycoside phosphotransferase family enzyme/predicted kinase
LRQIKRRRRRRVQYLAMNRDEEAMTAARARVDVLRAALEAEEGAPVRLVETHISWVLLGRESAYKFKKPLRLPFLDFRTLPERRRFCAEEVRLNRRLAPGLYLDVVDVRVGPDGPRFGGDGVLMDAAVHMRRFPDGSLWSERLAAGTLEAAHIDAFARRLSEFHDGAAIAREGSPFGSKAAHERVDGRLVEGIDAWQGRLDDPHLDWPALRRWLVDARERLAWFWPRRLHAGRIREGHGDLHLGNVVQLGDESVAFDGVEFDQALRWIDVLDDVAFLVMDLIAHGRRDLGFRALNAWLEASGDYDGLPALRFFLVSRALVRAEVASLLDSAGPPLAPGRAAFDYLSLAWTIASADDVRLAITHGLPGSGKTFVSQAMLECVGAVRVRADVERKRLFGSTALQPGQGMVDEGLYSTAATACTYDRLRDAARTALSAGWPTLLDAACLRRAERAAFKTLAAKLDVPFSIVDCRAAPSLLRRRIVARQARGGDASDADLDVLDRLAAIAEPLDVGERSLSIVVDAAASVSSDLLAEMWFEVR